MNNSNRFSELDALRGVSALSVILFHYTAKYREFFGHSFPEYLDFKYGFIGVDLFFIISGFVIFMTISKVGFISEFIFKRFIRLYPTFWICVIITFLSINLWGVIPRMETTFRDGIFNFLMFYRILRVFIEIKDVDGAYWSLLPELQFYFLISLVFIFNQLKRIYLVCIFWICLIIIDNFLFHIRFLGLFIDLKFGGFFIAGILFYKIISDKEDILKNHLFIVFTLMINICISIKLNLKESFFLIPFIYVIFYLFAYRKIKFLNKRVLLFLGAISYPLYLIHQNLGYAIIKQFELWGYTNIYIIIFPIMISVFIASLITFYVERPVLKYFKKKYNSN